MNVLEQLRTDENLVRRAFFVVLALGCLVRLYHLTAPIADRQSWNQISAATVIRHFVEDGIDPFHTQWDVLVGPDTGPRIELQEAPIYHVVVAVLSGLFGPYESIARLLTIIGSLLGAFFLFRLTQRLAGGSAALFAAVFYLFAPFSWFYGRAIMSDVWMLAMTVVAVERFDQWLRCECGWKLMQAAGAVMLAGLFKPFALHIGVTLLILQAARRGWRSLRDPKLVLFALVALALPLVWVIYAAQSSTLGDVVGQGESWLTADRLWGRIGLLWSGSFWFRIQARLFDQMATPVVTALAVLALLLTAARHQAGLALAWLAGAAVYLLLIRDGNSMHDYYQLPFLPPFALLAGLGLAELANRLSAKWIALILIAFGAISALYVRTAFQLDLSGPVAGQLIRQVSAHDDLIVVLDPGSTRKNQVIYEAHRRGWHTGFLREGMLEQYGRWGARWLVTVLEDDQASAHPEWGKLASAYQKITETRGPWGWHGKKHTIQIFDLENDNNN